MNQKRENTGSGLVVWNADVRKSVSGILESVGTEQGKYGERKYAILDPQNPEEKKAMGGSKWKVYMSTILANEISKHRIGEEVTIEYMGKRKSNRTGREYSLYKVHTTCQECHREYGMIGMDEYVEKPIGYQCFTQIMKPIQESIMKANIRTLNDEEYKQARSAYSIIGQHEKNENPGAVSLKSIFHDLSFNKKYQSPSCFNEEEKEVVSQSLNKLKEYDKDGDLEGMAKKMKMSGTTYIQDAGETILKAIEYISKNVDAIRTSYRQLILQAQQLQKQKQEQSTTHHVTVAGVM